MGFTFSRPTIASLMPSVVPTTGFSNAELIGDSFGDCTGVLQCYLRVQVTFPSYSIVVDLSDKVRRRSHAKIAAHLVLSGKEVAFFLHHATVLDNDYVFAVDSYYCVTRDVTAEGQHHRRKCHADRHPRPAQPCVHQH